MGCRSLEDEQDKFSDDPCGDCPWNESISDSFNEVYRIYRLLKLGVAVPAADITREEEDALLEIESEIQHQEGLRIPDGTG